MKEISVANRNDGAENVEEAEIDAAPTLLDTESPSASVRDLYWEHARVSKREAPPHLS